MATPRYKSFLGIAKESAYTPGVAPTGVAATDYIPITDMKPFDNVKYLTDNNWRGSMVKDYGDVQGNIFAEFEFAGDVFPDTAGYAYAGVLGDYTYTAGTPSQHVMSVKNSGNGQATTYSLSDYDGYNTRQFTGCSFGSVDTKFSAEGLLQYTAMANGFASAVVSTPTPTYPWSTVTNVPAWTGVTTIAGSTTAKLAEGDIKIARPLSPIFTVDGSQSPYQIFQGAVEVTGSMKLIFEDDTDLTRYLTNTQPSLDIAFSQNSGALVVQYHMTKCAFEVAKVDRSKDYVELDVTYRAIANSTDVGASAGYSPIKITIKNAVASAKYA